MIKITNTKWNWYFLWVQLEFCQEATKIEKKRIVILKIYLQTACDKNYMQLLKSMINKK